MIHHFTKTASRTFPSRTFDTITPHFLKDPARENNTNQEAFLCQSTIFERARKDPEPAPETTKTLAIRQASAKLHCLYGVPIMLGHRTRYRPLYPFACSVVYDMRNYTNENFWGPFRDDSKATVDWERMEAVMIVLGYNMKNYTQSMHGIYPLLWKDPFRGASPGSFEPLSITKREVPLGPVDMEDPYNVTGTWHRVSYPIAPVMIWLNSSLDCMFLRYASLDPFPISIPIPRPLICSFLKLTHPRFPRTPPLQLQRGRPRTRYSATSNRHHRSRPNDNHGAHRERHKARRRSPRTRRK